MNKRGLKTDGTLDLRGATIKHGLINHPLYDVWCAMNYRCYKETHRAYKWYGAKGIRVCREWRNDFKCFYDWAICNGWRKGLSLERIKNHLSYSPKNCTFIERAMQSKNRTSNRRFKIMGKTMILADWCRYYSIKYMIVLQRLNMGWPIKKSLTHPIQIKNHSNNL